MNFEYQHLPCNAEAVDVRHDVTVHSECLHRVSWAMKRYGKSAVASFQLCDELLLRDVQQSAEPFAMLSNVTTGFATLELH